MSISQTANFLTGLSKDEIMPKYYFMYDDHFSHEAFQKHFAATKQTNTVSVGMLKDWTWHINTKHKPNIRFTFKEHKSRPTGPVLAPATEFPSYISQVEGAFGFVMELDLELKSVLDQVYDATRVAMIQNVSCYVKNPFGTGLLQLTAKALVYWDPLHTADGLRKNLLVNEREQWKKGLMTLKSVGVPDYWLYAVQRRLVGERVDPEPLFSDFPRVPKPLTPGHLHIPRSYRNYRKQEELPAPCTTGQRVQQPASQGLMGSLPRQCRPIIQQQSAIHGQIHLPPKPSTTSIAHHKSTIQGAANENPISQRDLAMQYHIGGKDLQEKPVTKRVHLQRAIELYIRRHGEATLQNMSVAQREIAIVAFVQQQSKEALFVRFPLAKTSQQVFHARLTADGRTLQGAGLKRKAESEDMYLEELKRAKIDGKVGGNRRATA